MDSRRQSIPELGAYRMVVTSLRDLLKAEWTLAIVHDARPDVERAIRLNALRSAIAQLKTINPGGFSRVLQDRCTDAGLAQGQATPHAARARARAAQCRVGNNPEAAAGAPTIESAAEEWPVYVVRDACPRVEPAEGVVLGPGKQPAPMIVTAFGLEGRIDISGVHRSARAVL